MRAFGVLALSVALQAAALTAPLVHEHPDDYATDHHAGRTVHAHWAGHAHHDDTPEGPALTDVDHDGAIFLNSFVAVKGVPAPAPALSCATVELSAPPEQRPYRAIEVVRSHDPPSARSLCSRAPPPFLS